MREIRDIMDEITEHYSTPIRIGSRCEADVFYRVEDMEDSDLEVCANYVADRIMKVCSPNLPSYLISLFGSYTEFPKILAGELAPPGEMLEVFQINDQSLSNGKGEKLKNANVILVSDVITTARSCLEAHTKITMIGAQILCWASLIDRTFGPGPVPVVSAHTGAPVQMLEELP